MTIIVWLRPSGRQSETRQGGCCPKGRLAYQRSQRAPFPAVPTCSQELNRQFHNWSQLILKGAQRLTAPGSQYAHKSQQDPVSNPLWLWRLFKVNLPRVENY